MNERKARGVNYIESLGKWGATFCYQQKKELIGKYDTFEDALVARLNREKEVYSKIDNIYKRQRLLLHMTQKEVAKKAGICEMTYVNFERGKSKIMEENLKKIAEVLGLDK